MVDYLYTMSYHLRASDAVYCYELNEAHSRSRALVHAQIFVLPDKFDIPGLCSIARKRFRDTIRVESMLFFSLPLTWQLESAQIIEAVEYVFNHMPPNDNELCLTVIRMFLLHELLVESALPSEYTCISDRLDRVSFDILLARCPSSPKICTSTFLH